MAVDLKLGKVTCENKPELSESDEPVFVFRAQDVSSIATLDEYRFICELHKETTPEHLAGIDAVVDAFEKWQHENRDRVKVAD